MFAGTFLHATLPSRVRGVQRPLHALLPYVCRFVMRVWTSKRHWNLEHFALGTQLFRDLDYFVSFVSFTPILHYSLWILAEFVFFNDFFTELDWHCFSHPPSTSLPSYFFEARISKNIPRFPTFPEKSGTQIFLLARFCISFAIYSQFRPTPMAVLNFWRLARRRNWVFRSFTKTEGVWRWCRRAVPWSSISQVK